MNSPDKEDGFAPALRAAVKAAAVVSACFCLLVAFDMMFGQIRMVKADVLNDPRLRELRARFSVDPENEHLKQEIRRADLTIRRIYFAHQERTHAGARLLLWGALVLLVSLAVAPLLRSASPDLEAIEAKPSDWRRRRIAQAGILAGVLALAAIAALTAWALRHAPEREPSVPAAPAETLSAPPDVPSPATPSRRTTHE